MDDFTIRPFAADEWPAWRALRLAALADAPDAFGARLADAAARSDATWQELLMKAVASPADLPLLASVGAQPAGLAWAQEADGVARVYQVWVAPAWRGRGIAHALITRVIGWARERSAAAIELDVTVADSAAVRLYRRLGFVDSGAPVPMGRGALMEQPMRLPLSKLAPG